MNKASFWFLVRYLISGGTGAACQILLLFIFHTYLHLHYIAASALSFILSIFVGFFLQKFWTFKDNRKEVLHRQFFSYAFVIGIGLLLNTILMYFFVDKLHLWYILAQIITSGLIAIQNIFIYKYIVFKKA